MIVERTLVLNIEHLRKATELAFANGLHNTPCLARIEDFGYLVYADDTWTANNGSVEDTDYVELCYIFDLARVNKCAWVRFDTDGPIEPQLAFFDWDHSYTADGGERDERLRTTD